VALERGRADSASATTLLDGVLAVVRPVVECNRKQIDNGRTYLREIVFGDPGEPHHREALGLTTQTEELLAAVIAGDEHVPAEVARTLAHVVSAIMFISMAATVNAERSVDEIVNEIAEQIRAILPV
jgi:TetR/AcrR family transcriptional regulator